MTALPAPPLLNDLYQFTMAEAYLQAGMAERRAVFELFFRRPPHGGVGALAAGLDSALDFIERLSYGREEISYLRSLGLFSEPFLERLARFRFSGEVEAVPEGTVVFPREPLLRVEAGLLEAQILESTLLNLVGFPTLVATKAARMVMAAAGAEVIEFGMRRAQGPDGALTAARAAFIGGCLSTSNLEAGRRWDIPVRGTMAHSLVMAFPTELEAFRAYARAFPHAAVLLLDTYHTLESGLPSAITVARELRAKGDRLAGVRLDSGDLARLSVEVRRRLDEAGFPEVKVLASGDLDERRIAALVAARAPVDAYGVGTRLASSEGDAALTCVYKLTAVEERPGGPGLTPRRKTTDDPDKGTLPGPKQAHRLLDSAGRARGDLLALAGEEKVPAVLLRARGASLARPLLEPAVRAGRRVAPRHALAEIQARARAALEEVPLPHRRLEGPEPYPVLLSPGLEAVCASLDRRRLTVDS